MCPKIQGVRKNSGYMWRSLEQNGSHEGSKPGAPQRLPSHWLIFTSSLWFPVLNCRCTRCFWNVHEAAINLSFAIDGMWLWDAFHILNRGPSLLPVILDLLSNPRVNCCRWTLRGDCQNLPSIPGCGLWFLTLFFFGFLIFSTYQKWP